MDNRDDFIIEHLSLCVYRAGTCILSKEFVHPEENVTWNCLFPWYARGKNSNKAHFLLAERLEEYGMEAHFSLWLVAE